jgi:hypothetical protein
MQKTLAPLDGLSDAPCAAGASPSTSHSRFSRLAAGVGAACGAEGIIAQRLMGSPRQEASHRMSEGHIGQEWLPAGRAAASPVSTVL